MRHAILFLSLAIACGPHAAPPPVGREVQLPAPTGRFAVGRLDFEWTDQARGRVLEVVAWYPSRGGGPPASYIPGFAAIEGVIGAREMKAALRGAYASAKRGAHLSHALAGAPVAAGKHPVLLFSHGFGETGFSYAALLEDLASHGFAVLSVEHPGDAYAVALRDGRVIRFDTGAWEAAKASPDLAAAYQLAQIPIRTADLAFIVRQLLAGAEPAELAGKLDLERIGALGHSLGGMAAADACAAIARLRACANLDADYEGVPWRAGRPSQPFLFFATPHSIYASEHLEPPTDEALASMKRTRAEYEEEASAMQRAQDEAMAGLPGGGYRIQVERDRFTHGAFLDPSLLNPTANATDAENMELARRYVGAFFARHVAGGDGSALDQPPADPLIRIDRYPPR